MGARAWRVVRTATALGVGALMVAAGAQPASAATLTGAQDSVVAFSDAGDYIGAGEAQVWRGSDSRITLDGGPGGASVSVSGGPSKQYFTFDLASAAGRPLGVGVYTDAERTPFRSGGHPGIAIYGSGRGCNTDAGSFEIRDIARDADGDVTRLWAVYEQHCEGGGAAMWGEIRLGEPTSGASTLPRVARWPVTDVGALNTPIPVTLVAGPAGTDVARVALGGDGAGDFRIREDGCTGKTLAPGGRCQVWLRYLPAGIGTRQAGLTFVDRTGARSDTVLQGWQHGGTTAFHMTGDAGDWITGGGTYDFTPANARFSVYGSRRGLSASVTGNAGQWWYLDFSPADDDILVDGATYDGAHRDPFRGAGAGIDVSGEGRGCNEITGVFTVDEARWVDSGAPRGVGLRFEQHCESGTTSARGSFQWRAGDTAVPPDWMTSSDTPTTLPEPPALADPQEPTTTTTTTPAPPTTTTTAPVTTTPTPTPKSGTTTAAPAAAAAQTSTSATPAAGAASSKAGTGAPAATPAKAATPAGATTPSAPAADPSVPLLTFRGLVAKTRVLRFSVRLPRAGSFALAPTAKVRGADGRARTLVLGRGSASAKRAGTRTISIRVPASALKALIRSGGAPLTTRTTWRPEGATAVTSRATDVLRVR